MAFGILRANKIPFWAYFKMVALFISMSVINNKATAFEISVPLHMVFRSGSLIASMSLGYLLMGKRYSLQQTAGVLLVTAGIFTVTLATALEKNGSSVVDEEEEGGEEKSLVVWLIGLAMLAFAVLVSALLGLLQESTYKVYGRGHTRETMFYTHALSLPYFVFLLPDIWKHVAIFSASPPLEALPIPAPGLWVSLAANVLLQYVCIRGVYLVVGYSTALTTTLVITLRKFVSLLVSIWLFSNPFTHTHWIGTAALFAGSLLYSLSPKPSPDPSPKPEAKSEAKSKTQ